MIQSNIRTVSEKNPNPSRILVVDDHPAVRLAVVNTIDGDPSLKVIGEAGSASETMRLIDRFQPDAAVIDLSLEDADGLGLVETIRIQFPSIRMVVFSMYDETHYAERALRAGAQGYVMKTMPTSTLIEALKAVLRGEVYLSARAASRLLGQITNRQAKTQTSGLSALSDREMAVLQMLGEGYGVEETADRLNLSPITVKHYRRSTREKLGVRSNAELLHYAIEWVHGQNSGSA